MRELARFFTKVGNGSLSDLANARALLLRTLIRLNASGAIAPGEHIGHAEERTAFDCGILRHV